MSFVLRSEPVPLLRFTCDSGSSMLDHIQVFLQHYTSAKFRPTVAEKVVVSSYELLANALNYGSVSADVTYDLSHSRDSVIVRVENETIPTRASMLREQLMRVQSEPQRTYMEEMGRSATGRRPSLGLARIVFEVGMRVELQQKDQRVVMIATTQS